MLTYKIDREKNQRFSSQSEKNQLKYTSKCFNIKRVNYKWMAFRKKSAIITSTRWIKQINYW